MLLVASVNKTREDEIDNDTVFIFVINLRNETECYRSKRERNCSFRENVNTYLQNKKTYLMVPSSHGHFHFNFACKDGRVTPSNMQMLLSIVFKPCHYKLLKRAPS